MAQQDDDSFLSDDEGGYAPVDFGGEDDDDDNEHTERFPTSFIHDGDHRFSSESFQTTFEASQPPSQATLLLDAIAAGDISGSQSNYEFFNNKALETIQGNQWAGAAHWKKIQPKRNPRTPDASNVESTKTTKRRQAKTSKTSTTGSVIVKISKIADRTIEDALKKSSKGKRTSESLQMTKAAILKASKNENVLPFDAGIKLEHFTSLFLRPNTNIREFSVVSDHIAPPRQVGFGGVETWDNHDDNSFDDNDNEGAGFDFGGDNDEGPGDFIVPELEGVRKVEKVKVGYATVAKKVDVKRLKHDLWEELERTFQQRGEMPAVEYDHDMSDNMQIVEESTDSEKLPGEIGIRESPLSFQETVREMQTTQCQQDVTLPFYFICILHLANEKGLALESIGLDDFIIHSS